MPGSTQNLDARKKRLLEAWVDNPTLSFAKIAAMANVSETTFWRYRQDPQFMETYKKMCQARFKELEAKAVAKVGEQIDEGNFQAVKYVLDSLGYKPKEKIEANVE